MWHVLPTGGNQHCFKQDRPFFLVTQPASLINRSARTTLRVGASAFANAVVCDAGLCHEAGIDDSCVMQRLNALGVTSNVSRHPVCSDPKWKIFISNSFSFSDQDPLEVPLAMREYIVNFFGCRECGKNFLKESKNLENEISR